MKKIIIAISLLILAPVVAYAEGYRVEGVYEISIPDGWQLLSKPAATKLMEEAKEIVGKSNIKIDIDPEDLSTPFVIYKNGNNEEFLARVIIGPPEVATEGEFDSLTAQDLETIGEYLSGRQNQVLKNAGYRLASSRHGKDKLKGTSAFHMVRTYYDPKGFKVSRGQYIVYRTTATIIISMEHTVQSGEPDYKLIENEISSFSVLAK